MRLRTPFILAIVTMAVSLLLVHATPPADDVSAVRDGRAASGSGRMSAPEQEERTYVLESELPVPSLARAEGIWPLDVDLLPDGRAIIVNARVDLIQVLDSSGDLIQEWESPRAEDEWSPRRVSVDAANQRVAVEWQGGRQGVIDYRSFDGEILPLPVIRSWFQGVDAFDLDPLTGNMYLVTGENLHWRSVTEPRSLPLGEATDIVDIEVVAGTALALLQSNGSVHLRQFNGDVLGELDLAGRTALDIASNTEDELLVYYAEAANNGGSVVGVWDLAGVQPTEVIEPALTTANLGAPSFPVENWPWRVDSVGDTVAIVDADDRFRLRLVERTDTEPVTGTAVITRALGASRAATTTLGSGPSTSTSARIATGAGGAIVYSDRLRTVLDIPTDGTSGDGEPSIVIETPPLRDLESLAPGAGRAGGGFVATTFSDEFIVWETDTPEAELVTNCDCRLGGRVGTGAGIAYISEPMQRRVRAIDLEQGISVATIGMTDALGVWPYDVAASVRGDIFTADLVEGRIQHWERPDAPETSWQAGLLAGPRSIAVSETAAGLRMAALMADGMVELHSPLSRNLLLRFMPAGSDGEPLSLQDIAIDADERILGISSAGDSVYVFEPVTYVPTPAPEPSPSPTPADGACRVEGDKWVHPRSIVLGQTAAVSLTIAADCPGSSRSIGADIVLAVDVSSSMAGAKIEAAKDAAQMFAELLDVRHHRVGVVWFSDRGQLALPLSSDSLAAVEALSTLDVTWGDGPTDVGLGISIADDHLSAAARDEALQVLVLLTDARYDGAQDPRGPALEARNRGVQIYAVGLGSDVDADVLQEIAGGSSRLYLAPEPEELFPIYREILRTVLSSLAGNLVIDDEMGADIDYVMSSANPPALEQQRRLRWGRSILPSNGITLTYEIRPRRVGVLPTNREAVAEYTDGDGARRRFVFPVPEIEVIAPTPTPTPEPAYLPSTYNQQCVPGTARADIVLLVDTSSSMTGGKLDKAKDAASRFARLLDPRRDRVAVVGFDAEPRVVANFTSDLGALEGAIGALEIRQGTRIDRALATATDLLSRPGRDPRTRGIAVLLSDGAHGGPVEDVYREADRLKSVTFAVYAIGLGEDVQAAVLAELATPARYYSAATADDLAAIYEEIAVRIPCR